MELDDIEETVVAALRELDEQPGEWSDMKATRMVKNAVAGVGDGLGLAVHAASCRYDDIGEWLFDLCWCTQDERDFVLDMPLALECEWQSNPTAILEDFQKLLVSRADHRIFLCSQATPEDWTDCVEYLTEQIQLYGGTRDGDRYLLGCWTEDGWQFQQYVHPGAVPKATRVWLFQANKDDFVLVDEVTPDKTDYWRVKQNHDKLQPHDIVFLWQSGDDAGIYGHGKVISRVRKEEGESVVDMRYTKLLDTPILKVLLRKHPVLKTFGVIAMPHGRNPFRVRDHEWDALKKLSVELREIANSGGSHRKNKG